MEAVVNSVTLTVRRETRNGREYLVAPMTLISPGVLNGSKGPLLYPPDEVGKDADRWNDMPIVVYHPVGSDGAHLSGRQPAVLDKVKVGRVYNATFDGKLRAEGWFDAARTKEVDPRIYTALTSNKPLELSTGLFTDNEPAPPDAVHNGRPYSHVARNYKPDHLAILPDQTGACSLSDGCGVLANEGAKALVQGWFREFAANAALEGDSAVKLSEKDRAAAVGLIVANCKCDEKAVEKLDDDAVTALKGAAEKVAEKDAEVATANAAKKAAEDEVARCKALMAETKEKPAVNAKPPTMQEWLATMPGEAQAVWNNAVKIEQREREACVARLVANVQEGPGKQAVVARLKDKSLDELRDLLALAPAPAANESPTFPSYLGAAAPATNAAKDDSDNVLPTFNYDFGEMAKH